VKRESENADLPRKVTHVLSVVCPVYNEADNIIRVFDELRTKVSVPMEVLIVYDRQEDNTLPVVRDVAARYPFAVRLIRNRFGAGALNAIRTGFLESQGEAVLVVMADLSDDLSRVDEMYRLVTAAGFAIVNGSRYALGGRQIGGPFLKRLLSRLAGVSLHYLVKLPTHDVTNSFKMYRQEFLKGIIVESTGGFEIGMELVVKAFVHGDRITELPTTWTDRTAGQSRFRLWKWLPHYLRWYFYAFRKLRVRKSLTEV
jgi:dolichol-phosphate mannosyltransferase